MSDILNDIQIDDDAKKVFLSMPREEQLLAILGMLSYVRSDSASTKKRIIVMEKDFNLYKEAQDNYRLLREREEKYTSDLIHSIITGRPDEQITRPISEEDLMTTTQKVIKEVGKAFAARFDFWVWLRDKVLPSVIAFVILGLLALVFANKMP